LGNRKIHRSGRHAAFLLLAALTAASGCRSARTTKYLHPNMDLGVIKRVAVLPFENVTPDRAASDKVQKVFLTELLALEAFEVVEPGQVNKFLKGERIESVDSL